MPQSAGSQPETDRTSWRWTRTRGEAPYLRQTGQCDAPIGSPNRTTTSRYGCPDGAPKSAERVRTSAEVIQPRPLATSRARQRCLPRGDGRTQRRQAARTTESPDNAVSAGEQSG